MTLPFWTDDDEDLDLDDELGDLEGLDAEENADISKADREELSADVEDEGDYVIDEEPDDGSADPDSPIDIDGGADDDLDLE